MTDAPAPKILLAKLRALGDTALLTASVRALKALNPQAELHVLLPEAWADLLEGQPGIDRLWRLRRDGNRVQRSTALGALAVKLRAERFDWALNPHASPSSALLMWATRAPTRAIHFHGHRDANRFSTVTVPGKGSLKPSLERDLDVLRALGLSPPPGTAPTLNLDPARIPEALSLLPPGPGPLLLLGLGASRPTKRWPVENAAQIARRWLTDRPDGRVALLVGPVAEETALGSRCLELIAQSPIDRTRSGLVSPPLPLLPTLLSQASVFLTSDSGPKHVAVAVGTPTVTVFGPEDPYEWHPYSRAQHPYAFIKDLSCRRDAAPGMPPWCGLQICTEQKHRCMTGISVDAVYDLCRNAARNVSRG